MTPLFAGGSDGFGPAITATEIGARRQADDPAPVADRRDAAATVNAVRQADAARKALALLREWLSPEQLAQFKRDGCFEVVGRKTGKRYRIQAGQLQNVFELDTPFRGWCFMPQGGLPTGDVMLAQKIALETDEEAIMKVAVPFWGEVEMGRLVRWIASMWAGIDRSAADGLPPDVVDLARLPFRVGLRVPRHTATAGLRRANTSTNSSAFLGDFVSLIRAISHIGLLTSSGAPADTG